MQRSLGLAAAVTLGALALRELPVLGMALALFARRPEPEIGDCSCEVLLGRPPRPPLIEAPGMMTGRRILVTGAGGTVGSELCRAALQAGARRVVALDHSEYALYALLEGFEGDGRIAARLASVADEAAVEEVFAGERFDAVYHAAAYKHVRMVEANAVAGAVNNVLGSRVVAEAARRAGTPRFVLVSTDKAARPRGLMGATKRLAEIVVQDIASRGEGTTFSIVRFGNVFGSSGSVVPRFARQIAAGGPVTLSDPAATRYFVDLHEAAQFVLVAGAMAGPGAVHVLDMGPPVLIRDLAERMIAAAGRGRVGIRITGLGEGESLHEHPAQDGALVPTAHPRILQVAVPALSQHETAQMLRDLQQAISLRSAEDVRQVARHWADIGGRTDRTMAQTQLG